MRVRVRRAEAIAAAEGSGGEVGTADTDSGRAEGVGVVGDAGPSLTFWVLIAGVLMGWVVVSVVGMALSALV